MTQKFVCDLDTLEEGEITKVSLDDGRQLAIYLVGERVYATDDQCTHGKASLAGTGSLDGLVVECGLHLGSFDIRTGAVVSAPCTKPLKTYLVSVRDKKVWVDALTS